MGRPLCLCAYLAICVLLNRADAQIYRWDNGQLIPGTEQITLGPGAALFGWDTEAHNLRFGDFQGDLSRAQLYNSWLDNARFIGADLSQADLSASTLTSADLTNSNLTYAILRDTKLTGAVVTGTEFGGTGITHAQLYSTASYQAKDLQGIELWLNSLSGWDLSGQNLTGADLTSAILTDANLAEANLSNARLNKSRLAEATFAGALVTGAQFGDTTTGGFTQEQLRSTASYQAKNLQRISLRANDALGGWDFSGQDLTEAQLDETVLTDANFKGANLTGAKLSSSSLTGVNFAGANLRRATLAGSILAGADLAETAVTNANFGGTGITQTQLQSTASYQANDLHGLWLSYNDLSGWDFSQQNLTGADLKSSTLRKADLTGALVSGVGFHNTTLWGFTQAQLQSTASYQAKDLRGIGLASNDLTEWDLTGQDLTNANLSESTLTGASLSQAIVTGADLSATTSRGFTHAQLQSTASYRAKNLQGIGLGSNDLTGWDFSGQNFLNAHLGLSKLDNANLVGSDLRGAVQWTGEGLLGNTIEPNGVVKSLIVDAQDRLRIRDDDGVTGVGANWWSKPRAPISLRIQQQMTLATGGVLELVLDGDAWDSTISFQSDVPVLLGGTLELTFTEGTELAAQSGRVIKAFDWTGVRPQGQLSVQGQLGTAWETGNLFITGEVTLLGLSSDIDGDKDVDSADLLDILENWTGADSGGGNVSWHDGDSDGDGDVDSADMLVFLSHWSGSAAGGGRVVTAPEPSCRMIAGFVAAVVFRRFRRRGLLECHR